MSTPKRLTPARLRESLAATRLPEDPTDVVMPPGSEQWPGELREALTATLKPAGVLVPVIEAPQADGLRAVDPGFQADIERRLRADLAARALPYHDLSSTPREGWLDAVEALVVEALKPPQLELL